jgi:hypothetical protein
VQGKNATDWPSIKLVNQHGVVAARRIASLRPPLGTVQEAAIVGVPLAFDCPAIKSNQVAV